MQQNKHIVRPWAFALVLVLMIQMVPIRFDHETEVYATTSEDQGWYDHYLVQDEGFGFSSQSSIDFTSYNSMDEYDTLENDAAGNLLFDYVDEYGNIYYYNFYFYTEGWAIETVDFAYSSEDAIFTAIDLLDMSSQLSDTNGDDVTGGGIDWFGLSFIKNVPETGVLFSSNSISKIIMPNDIVLYNDSNGGPVTVSGLSVGNNLIYTYLYNEDVPIGTFADWIDSQSSDTALSNLTVSKGILSPSFDSSVTSYAVSVENEVESIEVTPTVENGASVTVNGYEGGPTFGPFSLNVGANEISVEVTVNGTPTTYTIIVTRKQSSPSSSFAGTGTLYYSLLYNTNGGSVIYPNRIAAGQGALKPTNPIRTGYTFAGWFEDAEFKTAFDFKSEINRNTWIFAKWIPATEPQVTLRFSIGKTDSYLKQGSSQEQLKVMDTSPIISEERTLLPIRFVIEPLGGTIDWSRSDNKVTIKQGTTTIELWIGNNTAKVNGVAALIDPANPAVMPVIVYPGRTMLPVRFISETLGCTVEWDQLTRGITVTQ